jgi:hypothetical protein
LEGVAVAVTVVVVGNFGVMVRFSLRTAKASLREYLKCWIPGSVLGAVIIGILLLSTYLLKIGPGSEILRLLALSGTTLFFLGALIFLYPAVMGKTFLRHLLDLGREKPGARILLFWLENRGLFKPAKSKMGF